MQAAGRGRPRAVRLARAYTEPGAGSPFRPERGRGRAGRSGRRRARRAARAARLHAPPARQPADDRGRRREGRRGPRGRGRARRAGRGRPRDRAGHGRRGRRGARPGGGHPRGLRRRRLAPPRQEDRAEDRDAEALRRRDPRLHGHLRDRPGRHGQDVPRDGARRRGADREAGRPDHPHPPRDRGGRAARLPPGRHAREGRPVPAAALRRPLRHDGPRPAHRLHGARHGRGGAARLHARPHAQRLVHHPRRGAEHVTGADADVPDAARLRLEGRRHRRRDPDRPAARPGVRPDPGARHPQRDRRDRLRRVLAPGRRPAQARAADRRGVQAARRGDRHRARR